MYLIAKEFRFSASHRLDGLPDDHPCSRLHGHNYAVIVELEADDLGPTGFVLDYSRLRPLQDFLDAHFDHQHLNDVVTFNPTAELLANYLYEWAAQMWPDLVAVTVKETEKTLARYRGRS